MSHAQGAPPASSGTPPNIPPDDQGSPGPRRPAWLSFARHVLVALVLLALGLAVWVGWWLLLSTWSPTEPDPLSRRIPLGMPLFGPRAMIHVQFEEAAFSYAILLSAVVVPCVYLAWHALRWLFSFRFPP